MSELIDRQAALDALMEAVKSVGVLDADDIKTVFDALPSVQHEKAQLSQEGTTLDLISRQEAIDAVEKNACNTQRIMDAVNNLPPAQPEPHEGHWINTSPGYKNGFYSNSYYCSECHDYYTTSPYEMKFCPNCGAKMTISK